jgi:hypothetical protein
LVNPKLRFSEFTLWAETGAPKSFGAPLRGLTPPPVEEKIYSSAGQDKAASTNEDVVTHHEVFALLFAG